MSVTNPRKRLLQDSVNENGSIEQSTKRNAIMSSYSSSKRLKAENLLNKRKFENENVTKSDESFERTSSVLSPPPKRLQVEETDNNKVNEPSDSAFPNKTKKKTSNESVKSFSFKKGKTARLKRHSTFRSVERRPVLNQTQIMKFDDISADRTNGNLYDQVFLELPEPDIKETPKSTSQPAISSTTVLTTASAMSTPTNQKKPLKKSSSLELSSKAPTLNFLPQNSQKVVITSAIPTTNMTTLLQSTAKIASLTAVTSQSKSNVQQVPTNTTKSSLITSLLSNPTTNQKFESPTPSQATQFQLPAPTKAVASAGSSLNLQFGQQNPNATSSSTQSFPFNTKATAVHPNKINTSAPSVPSNSFQFGQSKPSTQPAVSKLGFQAVPATSTHSQTIQPLQFGASTQSSSLTSTTNKSNFQFGNSTATTTSSASPFQFGQTASTMVGKQTSSNLAFGASAPTSSNAFQFGSSAPTSNSTLVPNINPPATTKPSIFSFQQTEVTSTPSIFSFGPASSTTTIQPASTTNSSAIFSFGQTQPISASNQKPPSAFQFGQTTQSSSNTFQFGQTQAASTVNNQSMFGQPSTTFPPAPQANPFGQSSTTVQKTETKPSPFIFGQTQSNPPAPSFGTPQNKPFAFGSSNNTSSNPGFNFAASSAYNPAPPAFGSGAFNQASTQPQHTTPNQQSTFNFTAGNNMFNTPQSGALPNATPQRSRLLKARRRMPRK